jgi:hypothetical protein
VTEGIKEIRVNTLAELITAVTPSQPDPESGRLRSYAVYRGVNDAGFHLLTSLDRLGTPELPPHVKGYDLEEHILRNFIRYSRPYLPTPEPKDWELLVLAQHHGLATRLLDWSYSPLIAAHFATLGGDPESDRVIWRLGYRHVHEHCGLPPLALIVEELNAALQSRGLNSVWEFFQARRLEEGEFVCLLEPAALDTRLVAQAASFTISSDKTRPMDEVLTEAGLSDTLTRYVIPASAVNVVRDQLDLCGINERRLFPDLEGVADEMRRYYSASATRANKQG